VLRKASNPEEIDEDIIVENKHNDIDQEI